MNLNILLILLIRSNCYFAMKLLDNKAPMHNRAMSPRLAFQSGRDVAARTTEKYIVFHAKMHRKHLSTIKSVIKSKGRTRQSLPSSYFQKPIYTTSSVQHIRQTKTPNRVRRINGSPKIEKHTLRANLEHVQQKKRSQRNVTNAYKLNNNEPPGVVLKHEIVTDTPKKVVMPGESKINIMQNNSPTNKKHHHHHHNTMPDNFSSNVRKYVAFSFAPRQTRTIANGDSNSKVELKSGNNVKLTDVQPKEDCLYFLFDPSLISKNSPASNSVAGLRSVATEKLNIFNRVKVETPVTSSTHETSTVTTPEVARTASTKPTGALKYVIKLGRERMKCDPKHIYKCSTYEGT